MKAMKTQNSAANTRSIPQSIRNRKDPASVCARPNRSTRAFTFIELLMVVLMVCLLAATALPALCRTTVRSTRMQCMSNLRRIGMSLIVYGSENQCRLPSVANGPSVFWPWDVPTSTTDVLLNSGLPGDSSDNTPGNRDADDGNYGFGLTRDVLYDPAFPLQNADGLWNYQPNSFRVIGYAMTLSGLTTVINTNQNPTIVPQPLSIALTYPPPPAPSQRVLVADVTISQTSENQTDPASRASYKYTGIAGGYNAPGFPGHQTSHLRMGMPDGGNLGMLDGHVEWRQFQDMTPRTTGGSPVFWW
jgi:prepilin-type processing-associated H-X9-DG protein